MKFLIIMKNKYLAPPEIAVNLFDAATAWGKRYSASKKIEQLWGFAGLQAGGGVVNVNSLEELNQIINECPFGPFSETEIYPLVDFEKATAQNKEAALAMVKK